MSNKTGKTFVGFGFGPIQTGLFLFEAYNSGNFSRFVVAEIDDTLINAVRRNGGRYTINVARFDKIDKFTLEGIEIYNPQREDEREKIVEAIAESDELATALPSVKIYDIGGDASVVQIIANGLKKRDESFTTIIYTAENNNRAAEILLEKLKKITPIDKLADVQVLNTVIGKMSGVISDAEVIDRMSLTTITPDIPRAILVEEFNKILISQITLKNYRRGIEVFIEKADLLPFEEAKLYGHNAIHALIAYLADLKGYQTIAQAGGDKQIIEIAHNAFINESGAGLIAKYKDFGDELFTEAGYREYAEDLLRRMVNPNLNDLVERVGRDHVRKLGYDDRIFGTMRIAMDYGIEPVNLALGGTAGIVSMVKRYKSVSNLPKSCPESVDKIDADVIRDILTEIWADAGDRHKEKLMDLMIEAFSRVRQIEGL